LPSAQIIFFIEKPEIRSWKKKIWNSLEDIETGEYGICEDCGEDISIERLKARPVTSYYIRCKTKRESLKKLSGT
jgi:DnaK suppressor protein